MSEVEETLQQINGQLMTQPELQYIFHVTRIFLFPQQFMTQSFPL